MNTVSWMHVERVAKYSLGKTKSYKDFDAQNMKKKSAMLPTKAVYSKKYNNWLSLTECLNVQPH